MNLSRIRHAVTHGEVTAVVTGVPTRPDPTHNYVGHLPSITHLTARPEWMAAGAVSVGGRA